VWSATGLSNFISAASILRLCEAVEVQFSDPYKNVGKTSVLYINHHHHHHKHQGLDLLIRSVSTVTTALSSISSVFQLFYFLMVCGGMISKGFGFVAFFASVESQFRLHWFQHLQRMPQNGIPLKSHYFFIYQ